MPADRTDAATTAPTNRTATDDTRPTDTMTDDTRPTDTNRQQTDAPNYKPTLQQVSHTNPYTNEPFGTTQTYGRGRLVAADGGQANADPDDDETLEDVDHTPDDDVDGAQGTFDRGHKGPDDEPDDE